MKHSFLASGAPRIAKPDRSFRTAFFALAAAAGLVLACPAAAAERIALVVGNSDYLHATKLRNAVADSRLVGATLKGSGFEVIHLEDVGIDEFYEGLEKFKQGAASARVGLVYFAGHGIEVDKTNYLLPVDAELESASQLRLQAISLDMVLADLADARLPAKLAILDCCRDNPLTRTWLASRSAGGGLGQILDNDLPEATMVIYSAGPGKVAYDGEGANSPFTEALVARLRQPGLDFWTAFTETSYDVAKATNRKQEPWVKVDGAGITFRELYCLPGEGTARFASSDGSLPRLPEIPQPELGSATMAEAIDEVPLPLPARGYFNTSEVFQRSPYQAYNENSQRSILRAVQAKLDGAGSPDGKMGRNTHNAILAHQRSASLPETGLLDRATLDSLGMLGLPEEFSVATTPKSGGGSSSRSFNSGYHRSPAPARGKNGASGHQLRKALNTVEQVSRIYRNFR